MSTEHGAAMGSGSSASSSSGKAPCSVLMSATDGARCSALMLSSIGEQMELGTIEQAIKDIKAGRLVIVADDEDRENEGDLICAAELVTPELVNFMIKRAGGLICVALPGERV